MSVRADLLGVEWMNEREMAQAIPPAYTEHIGRQLMAHVQRMVACHVALPALPGDRP